MYNEEDENTNDIIFEHFQYSDLVDPTASYVDEFLGIGKKKKAKAQAAQQKALETMPASLSEKNQRIAMLSADGKLSKRDLKTIKQFEKSERADIRTARAEARTARTEARKGAKEAKYMSKAQVAAAENAPIYEEVGQNLPVQNTLDTSQTEGGNTSAGQIGDYSNAMSSVGTISPSSGVGMGGVGGTESELPYYPEGSDPVQAEEMSSAATGEDPYKELEEVRIVSGKGRSNVMLILGAIAVLALIYFFIIKRK